MTYNPRDNAYEDYGPQVPIRDWDEADRKAMEACNAADDAETDE